MSATATELSHVYPRGSRVNERGHLEVGGCDAVELAREFGTPAYVVAEDDLRSRAARVPRRAARAPRGLDGAVRLQGVSLHRRLPRARRGGARLRRGLRRRAGDGAAGRLLRGSDRAARQRQVRRRADGGARGRGRAHRARLVRRPRAAAPAGGGSAAAVRGCCSGSRPGWPAIPTPRSPPVRRTRSSGSRSAKPRRRDRVAGPQRRARPRRPALPHRLAAVRARAAARGGADGRLARPEFPVYNLGGGLAAAYTAAQHPPAVRRVRRRAGGDRARRARRGLPAAASSPGARWWPTAP